MDWGIHLPHLGRQATGEALITFSQRAEALGFHSGWVSDHIAWPADIESRYPYTPDGAFPAPPGTPWIDPIGALFFVAACTTRLKLGTSVLILGYRPPVQTAKAIASLDALSGGRVILGVGVGWMREEFDVLGMPFDHRGQRADEQLEVFHTLFTDEHPSHAGTYYPFPPIGFEPKPPTGRVPVWVGGNTEPAFRRTARFADGFHAAFEPVDDVRAAWARVRDLAGAQGRDPDSLTLSVRLYLDPVSTMAPAKSIAGSAGQMLDTVEAWRAVGVTHILLDPVAPGGVAGRIEAMERFMTEVAPRVS